MHPFQVHRMQETGRPAGRPDVFFNAKHHEPPHFSMRHNHLEEPIYDAPDTKSPAIEPARPPASSTHLLMRNNKPGKDLQQQCIYQCNHGYYLGTPPAIGYVECPTQPRDQPAGRQERHLHDKLRGRPDTSGQKPVHGQRRPPDALRSSPTRLGPMAGPGGHSNFNNP